jgi:hypothetical protein
LCSPAFTPCQCAEIRQGWKEMNPNEPHDFKGLAEWLQYVEGKSGFRIEPLPLMSEPHDTPQSVWLSLFQYDNQFDAALQPAIESLWLHEAGVFVDLPPDAAQVLLLRIYTAYEWLKEFVTKEESPLVYPDGEFQEVVLWLLVHWWKDHGIWRACHRLYLRGVQGTTVRPPSSEGS